MLSRIHQPQRKTSRAKQHRNGDEHKFLLREAHFCALPAVSDGGGLFYMVSLAHVSDCRSFARF